MKYEEVFKPGQKEEGSTYRFFRLLHAYDQIREKKPRNWLDLGCHNGSFLESVHENYRSDCYGADDWVPEKKTGSDVHECRFRNGGCWKYKKTDLAQSLGFTGPFQVISALEVLEHIIDTDLFLQRIHKALEPGGYVLITTPNINNLRNRIRVPLGLYPIGIEFKNVIHHVRLYNVQNLKAHLKEHGFHVLKMIGVQMFPRRVTHLNGLRLLSEWMADLFPEFCPNIICIAQKV